MSAPRHTSLTSSGMRAIASASLTVVLRITVTLTQREQAIRFFPNGQVLALHVLDERNLRHRALINFHLNARHFLQSRTLRGTPATLAGDDHPAPGQSIRFDKQWFEHALLSDRSSQLGKVAELHTWLIRIRIEFIHGDHPADLLWPVLRQLFDVMCVVTHLEACRQSSLRHGLLPLRKVFRTQLLRMSLEQS